MINWGEFFPANMRCRVVNQRVFSPIRRGYLRGVISGIILSATTRFARSQSGRSRIMPDTTPSQIELELLNNSAARKTRYGNQPMIIRDRKFTELHSIAGDYNVSNVVFDNCNFVGHQMIGVTIERVKFLHCRFADTVWKHGSISDIELKECDFHGSGNSLLAKSTSGSSLFEGCNFEGYEENKSTGQIDAPGAAVFIDCKFRLMRIHTEDELHLKGGVLSAVEIMSASSRIPRLVAVEGCVGDGLVFIYHYENISIKNCKFQRVDLPRVIAKNITIEKTEGTFKMLGVRADTFSASSVTFLDSQGSQNPEIGGGILAKQIAVRRFSIVDCVFSGGNSRLFAPGAPPQLGADGKEVEKKGIDGTRIPYHADFGNMLWRNTPFDRADLRYAHIDSLTIEDSTISDSQFNSADIADMTLKRVKLAGTLNFSEAKIKKLSVDALTRDAKLTVIKSGSSIQL
jgi:uncharacterized protein YjbI with pentapeptide repeats